MAKNKLGVIVGSNRRESINRKLAQALAQLGGEAFEAKFLQIDDLPMYNQDNEQPVPAPVARFKGDIEASDALLFVTGEHSRSIPAVLKNAIDWGARPWGKTSWPANLPPSSAPPAAPFPPRSLSSICARCLATLDSKSRAVKPIFSSSRS